MTSPRPSPSPKFKPNPKPKRKGEFGLWAVTKISWATHHPITYRGTECEEMVQIEAQVPLNVRKRFQVQVDSKRKNMG